MRLPRLPELVRREPLLLGLTAATACAYATFSVLRHSHYGGSGGQGGGEGGG